MKRTRQVVVTMALFALVQVSVSAQKGAGPASQLVITATSYDANNETLTITGANFGSAPTVTFELQPLTLVTATPQLIVAVLPPSYANGTHLLSVSRGPSVWENSGFVVTIGANGEPGPAGPMGPKGPSGLPGATGATGPAGSAGANGATGATGPAGADGATRATGPAGPTRAPGAGRPGRAPGPPRAPGALRPGRPAGGRSETRG